ncbi:MAG: hypothetical protein WCC36_08240 [Gammaproteobacteria bacterium]
MLFAEAILGWLAQLMVVVAVGAARDVFVAPMIGAHAAHQVMTLVACAAVFGAIVLFVRWVRPTPAQAWGLGGLWLLLGMAFEFGFFHYMVGQPWEMLLADYNLRDGRLLVLLWVTVVAGPYLATRLRR